ncbi:MAG: hypothetical protein QG657_286 [Acidobacteriota bacterium]|nr:hypothetical protein [Acidobacteriota bacterium]
MRRETIFSSKSPPRPGIFHFSALEITSGDTGGIVHGEKISAAWRGAIFCQNACKRSELFECFVEFCPEICFFQDFPGKSEQEN